MERVPLRSCCISGHLHEGEPTGQDVLLGGVNTYIAEPDFDNPKRAVIIATDVFGYKLVNTRLVADKIAKEGFLVVVPDIFDGKALSPNILEKMVSLAGVGKHKHRNFFQKAFSNLWTIITVVPTFLTWIFKYGTKKEQAVRIPIFDRVISDLKTKYDIEKIGMTGYCYGVFYCLHYAKENKENISACATAHGKIRVPEDISPLVKPTIFICADNDHSFNASSRKKAKEIIQQREDSEKFPFHFYEGTYHGFTIRGDECNPDIENAKNDALNSTVQFFKKYLAVDGEEL